MSSGPCLGVGEVLGEGEENEDECRIMGSVLAGSVDGPPALLPLLTIAVEAMAKGARLRNGPISKGGPEDASLAMSQALRDGVLPESGIGSVSSLTRLTEALTQWTADPSDPRCSAHLQCPPLALAVAADVVAASLNCSLDSWDQGPSSTNLETLVVNSLAELVGFDLSCAEGVMTSGGTESNLMGLLLSRDAAVERASVGKQCAAIDGLRDMGKRLRFFCSELAHFSIQRSASLLGMGESSVVGVPVDADHRMDVAALIRKLDEATSSGLVPAGVIATAGTTDFGSIDPLPEVMDVCEERNVKVHVDACYGGAVLFSRRLSHLIDGIHRADSVSLDLHKLGWQPIPAGVFLVSQRSHLRPLTRNVEYLNPADDETAGYCSLLGHSLRTTRRIDAFKIAVTFSALGKRSLGKLVEACFDLTNFVAREVEKSPCFELSSPPVLSSVVFRFRTRPSISDHVQQELRRSLLRNGLAVIGRTEVQGNTWLKLTILNHQATTDDMNNLLNIIRTAGYQMVESLIGSE